MKRRFTTIFLCILCLAMTVSMASASEAMTAKLEGNVLHIVWPSHIRSACVLRIYRDSWPVAVLSVNGGDGGANVALGDSSGAISVRLQTGTATLACEAKGTTKASRPTRVPARPAATRTPVPTAKPAEGASKAGLAAQVIAQVNQERSRQGLGALREDGELNRAAAVRARELIQQFSHTRPDGTSWSTVSASAYGENIARGQNTSDKVMAAWLTSEGHRANILRASFGSIGVCAYVHGGVTYWVQLFGH